MDLLRRSLALTLLALFLALSALPPAEAQDEFTLRGRQRLGDPPTAAPYILELWTDLQTERIRESDPPTFRFEIFHRANATPVVPGPDLQVFAFRCERVPGDEVNDCDPELQEATEVGVLLRDGPVVDGVYQWAPVQGEAFTSEGDWAIEVTLADRPTNNTAVFVFGTTHLPPVPGILTSLLAILFGQQGGVLTRIAVMLLWALLFVLVGRGLVRVARRTVLSPSRMDPTVGRLAVRLAVAIWGIFALAWTLWVVWRVNFWAGLTALGLLSVALGFGMQNTVANLMGGINLASDKPFIIGDRIQVGDNWGDVQEIGLRSTKIQTPRKEVVIIPNKLLDEREIWNYTREHQELRLDIDASISYDSDRRLAEVLMIQAAREHSAILAYPRPRVLLQGFADSGLQLQLRCWLQTAKDARIVSSDLRKAIKDKWDESGVEIPFPYRTLVYKNDLEVPRKADPEELKTLNVTEANLPKMLYATAGPPQIHSIADFVGKIASELDVALVVLYVTRPGSRVNRPEQYRVFSAFQDAAAHHTVPLRTVHRKGDVATMIKQVIEEEDIDLVGIGSHRHAIIPSPRKVADFTKEIRESVKVPVLIVPRSLEISTRTLNHYRNLVEERHLTKERRRRGIIGERDATEDTLATEASATGLPRREVVDDAARSKNDRENASADAEANAAPSDGGDGHDDQDARESEDGDGGGGEGGDEGGDEGGEGKAGRGPGS